ncbi:hypothetical protein KY285_024576 [Solanum tuberosum]|nr:hypothetical protein KY285_024576 [Solanum tuberosum]
MQRIRDRISALEDRKRVESEEERDVEIERASEMKGTKQEQEGSTEEDSFCMDVMNRRNELERSGVVVGTSRPLPGYWITPVLRKHLFSISIYPVHIFVSCVPGRNSISEYHLNNYGQRVSLSLSTEIPIYMERDLSMNRPRLSSIRIDMSL